jgi:hypothetical protein
VRETTVHQNDPPSLSPPRSHPPPAAAARCHSPHLHEEKPCGLAIRVCPADCIVSRWTCKGSGATCADSIDCGQGKRLCHRVVLRPVAAGGKACPVLARRMQCEMPDPCLPTPGPTHSPTPAPTHAPTVSAEELEDSSLFWLGPLWADHVKTHSFECGGGGGGGGGGGSDSSSSDSSSSGSGGSGGGGSGGGETALQVAAAEAASRQAESGYIDVEEDLGASVLFYLFSQTQAQPAYLTPLPGAGESPVPPKAPKHPLVLVLGGGYGCSPLADALRQGACPVSTRAAPSAGGGGGAAQDDFAPWLRDADVIYVDQPTGTGFSYSLYAGDQRAVDDSAVKVRPVRSLSRASSF